LNGDSQSPNLKPLVVSIIKSIINEASSHPKLANKLGLIWNFALKWPGFVYKDGFDQFVLSNMFRLLHVVESKAVLIKLIDMMTIIDPYEQSFNALLLDLIDILKGN
jgi:hypothetical protein